MFTKSKYLLPGCTKPRDEDLFAFYKAVIEAKSDATLPDDFQLRCIGGDTETTASILEHIRNGDKSGSVTVPQALQHSGQAPTQVGDAIILINFDGTPSMLVRITHINVVPYGEIDERHTALDGPKVRAIDVWKPVHVGYFNKLLSPAGLMCTDETPISFERFELICTAEELANAQ